MFRAFFIALFVLALTASSAFAAHGPMDSKSPELWATSQSAVADEVFSRLGPHGFSARGAMRP